MNKEKDSMIEAIRESISAITEYITASAETTRVLHNSICELRERVAMLEQVEKDGE